MAVSLTPFAKLTSWKSPNVHQHPHVTISELDSTLTFRIYQKIKNDSNRVQSVMKLIKGNSSTEQLNGPASWEGSEETENGPKHAIMKREDFARLLAVLGLYATPAQADELFSHYDPDNVGFISIPAFLTRSQPPDYEQIQWKHKYHNNAPVRGRQRPVTLLLNPNDGHQRKVNAGVGVNDLFRSNVFDSGLAPNERTKGKINISTENPHYNSLMKAPSRAKLFDAIRHKQLLVQPSAVTASIIKLRHSLWAYFTVYDPLLGHTIKVGDMMKVLQRLNLNLPMAIDTLIQYYGVNSNNNNNNNNNEGHADNDSVDRINYLRLIEDIYPEDKLSEKELYRDKPMAVKGRAAQAHDEKGLVITNSGNYNSNNNNNNGTSNPSSHRIAPVRRPSSAVVSDRSIHTPGKLLAPPSSTLYSSFNNDNNNNNNNNAFHHGGLVESSSAASIRDNVVATIRERAASRQSTRNNTNNSNTLNISQSQPNLQRPPSSSSTRSSASRSSNKSATPNKPATKPGTPNDHDNRVSTHLTLAQYLRSSIGSKYVQPPTQPAFRTNNPYSITSFYDNHAQLPPRPSSSHIFGMSELQRKIEKEKELNKRGQEEKNNRSAF